MNEKQQSFIGIDISKLWFDASLLVIKSSDKQPVKTERFDNNATGMKAFEKWLKAFRISCDENTLVVMGNTGIYQRHLWAFCSDKICHCILAMLQTLNGVLVSPGVRMIR